MSRFDYVKYDEETTKAQLDFKAQFCALEAFGDQHLPHSRWKSLFLTHLEYAYMAVGKALRDDQIKRTKDAELQESRDNS